MNRRTQNISHEVATLNQKLVQKPYGFASGLLLTGIGWLVVFYSALLAFFMAVPCWVLGTTLLLSSINFSHIYNKAYPISKILLLFPILLLLFFISPYFLAIGSYGFILGLGLWISAKKMQVSASPHMLAQIQQSKGKNQADGLSVYTDAKNLALLLSKQSNKILTDLIDAMNKLQGHLAYLQENHAYLAASVNELIKDLTDNSILRLDKLAQDFVHNGLVNRETKQLFAQQHETQINQLLNEHLQEVNRLNQSILEKKMATFDHVGSSTETLFRDKVMELKILLRWLVAKTPDSHNASYEVILKKLEESTLKQMQALFYKADTTPAQKVSLQHQVEDLIEHFKEKSHHMMPNNNQTVHLLEYHENQALDFLHQNEAQEFVNFNAEYIKQLKQHW